MVGLNFNYVANICEFNEKCKLSPIFFTYLYIMTLLYGIKSRTEDTLTERLGHHGHGIDTLNKV